MPDHVEALVNDFSKIEKKDVVCLVETGAGVKSGYPDSDYKKAGAIIVPSAAELYRLSSVIVKVKEPSRKEMLMVQEYQRIVAFFHIPPLREYIMPKVSEKTLILYAMERFWDEDGRDPLAAMSTI
ncbi:MAG: hypothetical protein M1334_03660, partial [Patescibacteria group bacterium]|nr:hypothetical protein [Patescibacteria group bacterium]